jgi:hypothetical protein
MSGWRRRTPACPSRVTPKWMPTTLRCRKPTWPWDQLPLSRDRPFPTPQSRSITSSTFVRRVTKLLCRTGFQKGNIRYLMQYQLKHITTIISKKQRTCGYVCYGIHLHYQCDDQDRTGTGHQQVGFRWVKFELSICVYH